MSSTPRIYVASLSDYNAGTLHGEWIDANQDADAINEEISAMLAKSPEAAQTGQVAEEWAIHDYDNFGSVNLGEHESIDNVAQLAKLLDEHGDAYAAWYANGNDENDEDAFLEAYSGEYDSLADYGRELELGGDIWTADSGHGTIYVFNGNV